MNQEARPSSLSNPPTSSTPFRFLDLPAEVRFLIYHYYYGPARLVLRYDRRDPYEILRPGERKIFLPCPPEALVDSRKLLGVSDSSIHQVSRCLAFEARPIWRTKIDSLTIKIHYHDTAMADFCANRLWGDLARELASLKIIDSAPRREIVPWEKIVECCPKLRIVDVTCPGTIIDNCPWGREESEMTRMTKKQFAEHIVQECVNSGVNDVFSAFEQYDLTELAEALEECGRRDYSVTGTYIEQGYDMQDEDSCKGCHECSGCVNEEEEEYEKRIWKYKHLQWDAHKEIGKVYESAVTLKFYPDYEHKVVSKSCTTKVGISGKWVEGMDEPLVTRGSFEEWEKMVLSSTGVEDVWVLPWKKD